MIREELIKRLELVKSALADNTLVPIFTTLTFKGGQVSAYNNELAIITTCDIGIKTPFAVNGKNLMDLLKATSVEEITFKLTEEELLVQAGKGKFKLPYFREEDFIFEQPKEIYSETTDLTEDLISGFEICLKTSSRDFTMPAMMGICIKFDNGITLYSTDGDAITSYGVDGKNKGKGIYTVGNSFCDAVIDAAGWDKSVAGRLAVNSSWSHAQVGYDVWIYGRTLQIKEPLDHETEIDNALGGSDRDFAGVPLGLNEALTRARVLADQESAPTRLTIKGGKLDLKTHTHFGEVEDVLTIRGHADVMAMVHASLVQRALDVCDKLVILENCTAYAKGDKILQVVSNIGE